MGETETRPIETNQADREASGARPYGRYLEDFEVGAVYKHWPAKTVTEADDHLFCLLTMNHHPLHINDVYAAESQQGRNVVVRYAGDGPATDVTPPSWPRRTCRAWPMSASQTRAVPSSLADNTR